MAFLDGELERGRRDAAQSHLGRCVRCRARLEELRAAAVTASLGLQCLDDEDVAAWVDHECREMKGVLSATEVGRIRNHLTGCGRCRAQVAALTKACRSSESIREGLSTRVRNVLANWRMGPIQTPRWAPVAVVGVVAVAVASVVLMWPGPVVRAPSGTAPQARREPAATAVAQRDRETTVGAGPVGGSAAQQPKQSTPPVSVAERPANREGRTALEPQIALVPDEGSTDNELETALQEWKRVKARGETRQAAEAALRVAGLLHKLERHREATPYYREAAKTAERAGEAQLRVDALVLLGAALTELGEIEKARAELGTALTVAKGARYARGERNARVQLELLPATEEEDER